MLKKIMNWICAIVLIISLCSVASASVTLNLPQSVVTLRVQYPGSQSYFTSQLKNAPSGYDVSNGTFVGWCGAKDKTINTNYDYANTRLYSMYNTSMPAYLWNNNWSKVNYVLNHKAPNATWWQIQDAIWYLLGYGDSGLNSDGWSMVQNASLYGDAYRPTYFDVVGIIADPGQTVQRHFIEFRPLDPTIENLTVLDAFNGQLALSWGPALHPLGFDHYEIFRDDSFLLNVTAPYYLDTGLAIRVLYDYTVRMVDLDGNKGPFSNGVGGLSTDTLPPSKVENLTVVDACNGNLSLAWDPATDNDGVDHYELFRNSTFLINATSTSYFDTGLVIGTEYTYTVRAVDFAGNTGEFSDAVTGVSTDGLPPTQVENLTVTDAFNGNLSLAWDPATDNVGVDHYEVWRDGLWLVNVTATGLMDTGLQIGTLYSYMVRAVDAAGNKGLFSDEESGISSDTIPPSQVENLTATDAKDGKIDLSWEPATDNVAVDHYEIFRDGVIITTTLTTVHQDTGRTIGQQYSYTVRAVDAAGNQGACSNIANQTSTATIPYSPPSPPLTPDAPSPRVANSHPIADLSAGEPYSGYVDDAIPFNGSFSYDPDGFITAWAWDFGDGTTGDGELTAHVYSQVGIFTVTLTVWDNKGATATDVTTALVTQRNGAPSEPVISGDTQGFTHIANVYSIVSTDENNDTIAYTVDWGDGTGNTSGFLPSGERFTIQHAWNTLGTYTVRVTASDGQLTSSSALAVIIHDAPVASNIALILLVLLALIALLLLLLFGKKKNTE